MVWVVYALLHSLLRALSIGIGRLSEFDGWSLTFLNAVGATLLLTLFTPWMAWSENAGFYIAAALVSLATMVASLIRLNLSSMQSGRVSSISMPIEAIGGFLIWMVISPDSVTASGDSLRLACITGAFLLGTVALVAIRANDISMRVLAVVAPLGLSIALSAVVTKINLTGDLVLPMALCFAYVQFLVMTAGMALALRIRGQFSHQLIQRPAIRAGLAGGFVSAAASFTFIVAVTVARNPGYVSFVAMLLPVWMIGWNRMLRIDDRASAVAAFVIILSVGMVVFAAA